MIIIALLILYWILLAIAIACLLVTRRHLRRLSLIKIWEIKVTCPDGELVHLDTESLYQIWRYDQPHTNDGYIDLIEAGMDSHFRGVRMWVKPIGWIEPDRTTALDGTATLPDGYR